MSFTNWLISLSIIFSLPSMPLQKHAKCWNQGKCPSVNEWIKRLWYIYTMEYYAAERKNSLLPFITAWMELNNIILSEISQLVKDKYYMISLLRGI